MSNQWSALPVELRQMILDRILSEYSLSNSAVDLGIGIFDSHQIAQHELSTLTWVSIEWAWEVRDARFAVVVIQGIDRLKSFWGCFSGEKVGRLPLRQLICSLGLDIHSPERHSRRSDAHHLKEMFPQIFPLFHNLSDFYLVNANHHCFTTIWDGIIQAQNLQALTVKADRSLDLPQDRAIDKFIQLLAQLPRLQSLTFEHPTRNLILNGSLPQFPNVEELTLGGQAFHSFASSIAISNFPKLERLYIGDYSQYYVSMEEVAAVVKRFSRQLTSLTLSLGGAQSVNSTIALEDLIKSPFPSLRTLVFQYWRLPMDIMFRFAEADIPRLEELVVKGWDISLPIGSIQGLICNCKPSLKTVSVHVEFGEPMNSESRAQASAREAELELLKETAVKRGMQLTFEETYLELYNSEEELSSSGESDSDNLEDEYE